MTARLALNDHLRGNIPMTDPRPNINAPPIEMALDDPLAAAARWHAAGHGVALATVVQTWGSSPRPAGSRLAIRDDGAMVGSVSGGCIEGTVVLEGQAAIQSGATKTMEFGVTDEMAWEVGLACGGTVRVFVEPLTSVQGPTP